jgi:hypothetical protein
VSGRRVDCAAVRAQVAPRTLALESWTAKRHWYPHPFLDVTQLGYLAVFWHVFVLTCGFFGLGLSITGIDRVRQGQAARLKQGAPLPDMATRLPRNLGQ